MDKLVLTSRCVMPKESQRRLNEDYNIHKRKIEQIMSRERIRHSQSNPYLEMMKKSKEANQRVEGSYNTQTKENMVLLEKLTNISRRKFASVTSFHESTKPNVVRDGEHRKIEQQNELLKKKLLQQRKHMLSKEAIRKDIKDYLQIRKALRRVPKASHSTNNINKAD